MAPSPPLRSTHRAREVGSWRLLRWAGAPDCAVGSAEGCCAPHGTAGSTTQARVRTGSPGGEFVVWLPEGAQLAHGQSKVRRTREGRTPASSTTCVCGFPAGAVGSFSRRPGSFAALGSGALMRTGCRPCASPLALNPRSQVPSSLPPWPALSHTCSACLPALLAAACCPPQAAAVCEPAAGSATTTTGAAGPGPAPSAQRRPLARALAPPAARGTSVPPRTSEEQLPR